MIFLVDEPINKQISEVQQKYLELSKEIAVLEDVELELKTCLSKNYKELKKLTKKTEDILKTLL